MFPVRMLVLALKLSQNGRGKIGAFDMSKRLRALLFGTADAVPGDYILLLMAVFGMMAAIIAGQFVS